jgi:hypothetical protein
MSIVGWLATAVTLPPTLAHEATHYLLARPWAADVRLRGLLSARPVCEVGAWADEAPRWGPVLAAYGPLVCGLLLALAGLLWAAVVGVGQLPRTTQTWLLAGVAAIWWGIYSWPSRADRRAAAEVVGDG